jgi:amino acid transporter
LVTKGPALRNPESESGEGSRNGLSPDLELRDVEVRHGQRPGSRYVRIMQVNPKGFRRVAPGVLEATEEAHIPRGQLARALRQARRVMLGRPLATAAQAHERLTKVKALAIFSSDALSSVAYATEEILIVLALAGAAALSAVLPISLAIAALLAVVALSYRQTIHAYPKGGGSYIVTRDNLGDLAGLTAGAALMLDYVLTVAVSISAGVAAITSAIQALHPYRIELALIALGLMMLVNLRGLREAGTIFAAPTYLFIGSVFLLLVVGISKVILAGMGGHNLLAGAPPESVVAASQSLTAFLVLRAFASGCTAMTGVEAVSDGVPAFRPPESDNAAKTLTAMAIILGIMFLGIGLLSHHLGLVPEERETILSQLGHRVFSSGPLYYVLQAATFLILVLAANTSFQDFPRLGSFMARDHFLPHQFLFRGDRLAFTNGITVLCVLSGALLVIFKADTSRLIPLYAVGVFLAFTFSQSSMVRRWLRVRGSNWRRNLVMNGLGAVTTGVVTLIIAGTKFTHGAWVVVVLVPCLVALFWAIHGHYQGVSDELAVGDLQPGPLEAEQIGKVIVPVASLNQVVLRTLRYARGLSKDVTAVHVAEDQEAADALRQMWERWHSEIPLLILETPYRSFISPLLAYIDALDARSPGSLITVVLPEFVPAHWWENVLHNQTALRLKLALLNRPNTVVTDVPYHLRH